jgi:hypothetical protein
LINSFAGRFQISRRKTSGLAALAAHAHAFHATDGSGYLRARPAACASTKEYFFDDDEQ